MSVDNRTPFPAIAFRQYNLAGQLLGVVAARGTFRFTAAGPLAPAEAQRPLELADVYDGDPHEGPLLAQGDLVPFKPATDVTFVGAAHSPGEVPRPDWTCRLRVGPVQKSLRVTGPRSWRARRQGKAGVGWELTAPAPVTYVPIDWRLAHGGLLPGFSGPDFDGRYRFNPLGRGIVDDARARDGDEYPAPQIEDPAQPLTTPHGEIMPQGFGPLSPWWRQRHQYAGSYTDDWLAKRHPLLPEDFDFRFWQCAYPDLIAAPWLRGDEPFELENLAYRYPLVRGRLPGLRLRVTLDQGRGPQSAALVLDGVHFDLRSGIARVTLTWRTGFAWPERRGQPVLECLDALAEAA